MTNCLNVRGALNIAEFTGQVVKITLCSGQELKGVVEKVCPTAIRLWVNPGELCCSNNEIRKAWIAIHAIESIAFDCENEIRGCCRNCTNQGDLQGIIKALNAAELSRQIVKVGLNCNGKPVKVRGQIIKISCNTFCIRLEGCGEIKEEKLENVEYVEFC
jgi:hypothetical protein